MSPVMGTIASLVFGGVLLTMIISIAVTHPEVLLIAAIAGLIAVVVNFISGFTWPPDLSGVLPDLDLPDWKFWERIS